jgi:hypothetical protein
LAKRSLCAAAIPNVTEVDTVRSPETKIPGNRYKASDHSGHRQLRQRYAERVCVPCTIIVKNRSYNAFSPKKRGETRN